MAGWETGWRLAAAAHRAAVSGRVTPHVVRHSTATVMIQEGADVRVVQEMLGHDSILMTRRYTHVSAEHLKAACRRAHPRF